MLVISYQLYLMYVSSSAFSFFSIISFVSVCVLIRPYAIGSFESDLLYMNMNSSGSKSVVSKFCFSSEFWSHSASDFVACLAFIVWNTFECLYVLYFFLFKNIDVG